METKPNPMWSAIGLVAALLLACVGMPWVYFIRDYEYVQGTARAVQDTGVLLAQALTYGVIGLLILAATWGAVVTVGLFTRWASPRARESATKIAIARAAWPELPDGLHSFTLREPARHELEPARLPVIDAEPAPAALPAPALPQARPGRPLLQQLDEAGLVNRSGHQLLIGEENGVPIYIDSRQAGVVAVGGAPASGKSSTVMSLLAQAALMRWGIVVCDPFPHKPDGVLKRSEALGSAVIKRASSPQEIDAAIRWVDGVGRRRLNGEPWRAPLILVIEEFSNLVIRKELPPETVALLPAMGMAYRSAGIIIIPIGHIWKSALLGGAQLGAVLRQVATHTIVHRLAPDAAELLLPIGSDINPATLPSGVALVTGPDGIYRVTVPWISLDDMAYASAAATQQGAPALPPLATTWHAPAPAAPPPAPPPAAAPAAETARLDPRLDEQILDLLAQSSELDAAEIAEGVGANPGTVRNRLAALKADGLLATRTDRRRFVYSLLRRSAAA